MGKYTRRGSAELDARIDADLARIAEAASAHSVAGILLGGYGRGEGTPFINPDGSQSPFNDYDLVVIVDKLDSDVRNQLKALEKGLSAELGLPVDLYPYEKRRLPRCEFSLLNYEMKHGHKVVWGDEKILDAMPDYPHDSIPVSEGTRLLLNRGKLLLDIKQRLTRPEPLSSEERIRFIKFIYKAWLALGDCALLAEKKYAIAYARKSELIGSIGNIPVRDSIIAGYKKAVALKEWGDFSAFETSDIAAEFNRIRETFLPFFTWYRQQYSQNECSILKAMALNFFWNGRPLFRHPRCYLYDALQELLKDKPDKMLLSNSLFCTSNFEDRFYKLQARFS